MERSNSAFQFFIRTWSVTIFGAGFWERDISKVTIDLRSAYGVISKTVPEL
jgi:hypothetical protein